MTSKTEAISVEVEHPKSVFVIGCPRSGTKFTSKVFRSSGFDVGHERMGKSGTSDWKQLEERIPDSAVVLHQVRHPLECMTSLQTIQDCSFDRLIRCTGVAGIHFDPDNRVETCARVWLFYNAQCEAIADITYRVESDEEWHRALETMGLPKITRIGTKRNTNSRRSNSQSKQWYRTPVTWDAIEENAGIRVQRAIRRMADRYGYE